MLPTTSALGDRAPFIPSQSYSRLARSEEPCVVESCSADMWAGPTAGCIDTGLPAGRRYFGQSDKPLVETANVHHARWVMFTETRWWAHLLYRRCWEISVNGNSLSRLPAADSCG